MPNDQHFVFGRASAAEPPPRLRLEQIVRALQLQGGGRERR
jgi:hypothetical protein